MLGAAGGRCSRVPVVYPAGTQPVALAIGDVNGDSRPDIVTSVSTGVAVLLQTAAGGFAAPVTTGLGSDSRGVVLGDFNGDARLDIASANAENFTLMLGNGAGGFAPAIARDPNFEPRGLAATDLDGDRLDVVVVNGSPTNGVKPILQEQLFFQSDGVRRDQYAGQRARIAAPGDPRRESESCRGYHPVQHRQRRTADHRAALRAADADRPNDQSTWGQSTPATTAAQSWRSATPSPRGSSA